MFSTLPKWVPTGIHLLLIVVGSYLIVSGGYAVLQHQLEKRRPEKPIAAVDVDQTAGKPSQMADPDMAIDPRLSADDLTNRLGNDTGKLSHSDPTKATRLDLKLWGTVTGATDRPYAVIEDGRTHRQQLYGKGDRVQDAVIKIVQRDKVIVSLNGREQVLLLENPASSYSADAGRPSMHSDRAPVRTQKIVLQRSQIDSAIENANDLLKQVNVRPHTTNGQPDGFIVSRIAPESIFRRMGLRNGDIINSVNDEEINTMQDAMRVYRQFSDAGQVNVQIKRRGRAQVLQYTIR